MLNVNIRIQRTLIVAANASIAIDFCNNTAEKGVFYSRIYVKRGSTGRQKNMQSLGRCSSSLYFGRSGGGIHIEFLSANK